MKHGLSRTYEHQIWRNMIHRCYNSNDTNWKWYGGRGITVCQRWRDDFMNFLIDVGGRPDGMTLDRIDNNGNYEPGNVRWITQQEQCLNRRNRWQQKNL